MATKVPHLPSKGSLPGVKLDDAKAGKDLVHHFHTSIGILEDAAALFGHNGKDDHVYGSQEEHETYPHPCGVANLIGRKNRTMRLDSPEKSRKRASNAPAGR